MVKGYEGTLDADDRAILFASATVTSLVGRRCKTPWSKPPAALFHCGARPTIDVAPRTSSLRIPRSVPFLSVRFYDFSIGERREAHGLAATG